MIADNRVMVNWTQGPCVEEASWLCPGQAPRSGEGDRGRVRAVEVAAVYGATIAALWAVLHYAQAAWWLAPGVLIAAGILPFVARRRSPPALIRTRTLRQDLQLAACASLVLFPLAYLAMYLLSRLGISLPVLQARPSNVLAWAVYQFLYVAVAEEVFFRGYVLASIEGMLARGKRQEVRRKGEEGEGKETGGRSQKSDVRSPKPEPTSQNQGLGAQDSELTPQHWMAIVASSGCFALAHVVVQGHAGAALTFLPGLALGWLYARTGTLLAPILFHGLANAFYCLLIPLWIVPVA